MTLSAPSLRARYLVALMAIVLFGAAVAGLESRTASALTNCTVNDTFDSEESAFLTLINNYRAQNGLGALSLSTNLNRSSAWLAVDMPAKSYFAHVDSLGRDPSTRAQNCGYPSGAGENIAAGTNWSTAQQAFDAWRNSPGHNANMLNGSYKQIGIARYYGSGSTYGWYWVTDFGLVNDGTSGSGSTTPTPPPPTVAKAAMTSPSNGATLPGASATFSWSAGSGALEYFIYAGTSAGANNLIGISTGMNQSVTLNNLPTDGATIYVRLWTRFSNGWQYTDYTYRAATTTATVKAAMTSPAPGSTITGGAANFTWTAGSGALEYFFYIGTTPGSNNLYGRSVGLSRGLNVSGMPTGTLYIRLWTRFANGWQYTDYTYASR